MITLRDFIADLQKRMAEEPALADMPVFVCYPNSSDYEHCDPCFEIEDDIWPADGIGKYRGITL